jgi:hypothetical protein
LRKAKVKRQKAKEGRQKRGDSSEFSSEGRRGVKEF